MQSKNGILALLYVEPMAGKVRLLMIPDETAAKTGAAYGFPACICLFKSSNVAIKKEQNITPPSAPVLINTDKKQLCELEV